MPPTALRPHTTDTGSDTPTDVGSDTSTDVGPDTPTDIPLVDITATGPGRTPSSRPCN